MNEHDEAKREDREFGMVERQAKAQIATSLVNGYMAAEQPFPDKDDCCCQVIVAAAKFLVKYLS